jgi:DNA (cytosine-5)-methyltransferase 1
MINGLDLFSGIGGISLALKDWVRPIAYCEIDPYCQGILLTRIANKDLYAAPIWDDIKTLSLGPAIREHIEIIAGGFPCQDISIARVGKGLEGERSGLFFEIVRLAKEIRPKFIFLENVPAITTRGGLQVVKTFAEMGYDCRWCVISAESVGAKHKRERWFLLAHIKSERQQETGFTERPQKEFSRHNVHYEHALWDKEPEDKFELVGMANGLQNRVDRVKSLGNAVVPEQAKKAFKILMGIE